VRAWGGPGVLREPAIVAAIAEQLQRERRAPESSLKTASAASGENGLRPVLRNSLLQRLVEALEQRDRFARVPLWPTVLAGFLAGAFIGWFVGEILYTIAYSPRTFPNAFRPGETVDVKIITMGIICGLLVWGGIVGLAAVSRSRLLGLLQGQLAVCIRELSTEFPDEVRAWGGEAILRDLYSVRELLQLIRNQPLTPV